MEAGHLNSLAEVGIGVNLAFGIVQRFRHWISPKTEDAVTETIQKIRAQLSEVSHNSNKAWFDRLRKGSAKADSVADVAEPWFVAFAALAALALFGFLLYSASDPYREVGVLFLWVIPSLTAGPIGLWSLMLAGMHGFIRLWMWAVEWRCGDSIRQVSNMTGAPISPVDPEQSLPPGEATETAATTEAAVRAEMAE